MLSIKNYLLSSKKVTLSVINQSQINNHVKVCKRFFSLSNNNKQLLNNNTKSPDGVMQNYLYAKMLSLNLKVRCQLGWQTECLFLYLKNNTKFHLSSPNSYENLLKKHFVTRSVYNETKKRRLSKLISVITAGQLGFARNKKKTAVASQSLVLYAMWFLRLYNRIFCPLLVRSIGNRRTAKRHLKELESLWNAKKGGAKKRLFALQQGVSGAFGDLRLKHLPRKRYRRRPATKFTLVYEFQK